MPDQYPVGRLYEKWKVILLSTVIVVFFPVIGLVFYIEAAFDWLRERIGLGEARADGFVFASVYALSAILAGVRLFPGQAHLRLNDIFLLGIVLTAYRFTWRSASFLFAIAVMVSAWTQPPDWFRVSSFAVVALFSIGVVARLKAASIPGRAKPHALRLHHAGMGR